MTSALEITTSHRPERDELRVVGEIDLSNADEFTARLTGAVTPGRRLLVDLTGVVYLDSAALATLFAHAGQLDIRISPLNESLFAVCGLDQVAAVEVVTRAGGDST